MNQFEQFFWILEKTNLVHPLVWSQNLHILFLVPRGPITENLNWFEPFLWVLDKKVCKEQQQQQQQEEQEGFEWICYSAGAEWKTYISLVGSDGGFLFNSGSMEFHEK